MKHRHVDAQSEEMFECGHKALYVLWQCKEPFLASLGTEGRRVWRLVSRSSREDVDTWTQCLSWDAAGSDGSPLDLSQYQILTKLPALQRIQIIRSHPGVEGSDPVFWLPDIHISLHGLPPGLKSLKLTCDYKTTLNPAGLLQATELEELALRQLPISCLLPCSAFANSLRHLDLSGCEKLVDLSALATYPDLLSLNLKGCNQLTDFSALQSVTKLKTLTLSGCRQLSDINCLEGLHSLTSLDASNCSELTDVSAVAGMKQLHTLNLSMSPSLASISALHACRALVSLNISHCARLVDFSSLTGCASLVHVNLAGCYQLRDLRVLVSCRKLETLNVSRCPHVQYISTLTEVASTRGVDIEVKT